MHIHASNASFITTEKSCQFREINHKSNSNKHQQFKYLAIKKGFNCPVQSNLASAAFVKLCAVAQFLEGGGASATWKLQGMLVQDETAMANKVGHGRERFESCRLVHVKAGFYLQVHI